jgi:hypothetical protein
VQAYSVKDSLAIRIIKVGEVLLFERNGRRLIVRKVEGYPWWIPVSSRII